MNGYYVQKVWTRINNIKAIDLRRDFLGLDDEKYIESIVTKEQFKSVEYKIKEEK